MVATTSNSNAVGSGSLPVGVFGQLSRRAVEIRALGRPMDSGGGVCLHCRKSRVVQVLRSAFSTLFVASRGFAAARN